jgi:hypothetical protein
MNGSVFLLSAVLVGAASMPASASASADGELRAELEALKSDYQARIAALEARLAEIESASVAAAHRPAAADAPVAEPYAASPADAGAAGRISATAFNPAMSAILGGTYAYLSQDPADYRFAGFLPAGDEIGPGERSFNLGESEVTLSANIDPYFTGSVTFAMTPEDELEVEEAWFRTLMLPSGLTLKGGRFFSGLGYLNEFHAHAWDFVDQPLVYQALFGGQFAQDGVQLKWLAPTDLFLELGIESGNGDAFPGTRRSANGLNGVTLYAHVGSDIGEATSWRAGVSWLDLRAVDRVYEDVDALGAEVENAFSGTSETWVADATLKWAPPGDTLRRSLKLQVEYMWRTEEGELAFDRAGAALAGDYRTRQDGWYVQGVYQFRPRWRAGLRYDALDSGAPHIGLVADGVLSPEDFASLAHATPSRTSLMLDWSLSEFSRLRAQYAWDNARDAATDEQFFLQYVYSLGVHGAHKF